MFGHNSFASLPRPFLVYVTDRHALGSFSEAARLSALSEKINLAASAGIHVQIREKDLSGRELCAITRDSVCHARSLPARNAGSARIIVNDRIDVALAEGADGVHLGEKSVAIDDARNLVDIAAAKKCGLEDFLIGGSCHSVGAARRCTDMGANYIFFGPIFATPSKASFGEPQGLSRLADVCRAMRVPVIAIGGITLDTARSCVDAGAVGIAAIRMFQDARDPRALVLELHQRLG